MTIHRTSWLLAIVLMAGTSLLLADQRRARPPEFNDDSFSGIFFEDVTARLRGSRPPITELGAASTPSSPTPSASPEAGEGDRDPGERWAQLISAPSLEDEVKRLILEYDALISTPGDFKSGGYAKTRSKLSILATLFAIISQYDGPVRWKADAPAARDLLARTALNAKSGSSQVYNEAKLRKQDLQDILRGTGLANRQSEAENDWAVIVNRTPLMEYLDFALYERLGPHSADPDAVREHADALLRMSEMVAVIGKILTQEGMDEADDPDYARLARAMTDAALEARGALLGNDPEAVSRAVADLGQSCDACHQQYR